MDRLCHVQRFKESRGGTNILVRMFANYSLRFSLLGNAHLGQEIHSTMTMCSYISRFFVWCAYTIQSYLGENLCIRYKYTISDYGKIWSYIHIRETAANKQTKCEIYRNCCFLAPWSNHVPSLHLSNQDICLNFWQEIRFGSFWFWTIENRCAIEMEFAIFGPVRMKCRHMLRILLYIYTI